MPLRDTLRHYLWVIRRYFRWVGLAVFVCTGTTAGFNLCLPPVYQASVLIMVNSSTNVGSDTNNDIYSNQALAFSYSFLVTKDDVLQAAVQQLPGMNIGQLKQAVSDSAITNTPMIEIRAQAANSQQAALIANVVARSFIRIQLGKVSADLQNQDSQLSLRLQAAQVTGDAAQTKLIALQANHASASEIASQRNLTSTYQANYASLLDSYHHLQLLELQTPDTLNIFQLATPPELPVSPLVWLNATVAAALSLLLAVVVVLLLDWMDETIKTEEDVMRLTPLKALGSVPSYVPPALDADSAEKPAPSEKSIPIARSEAIDESFIPIKSALLGQFDGKRSIMVTGLHPACGTSTVAANLAVALTRSGRRVLLIDANLRRPALHMSGFQFFHSQSLVNCLAALRMYPQSRQDITSWLNQWRTLTPYLWLLPAGPIPLHPASLLSIPELCVLIHDLLASQSIDLLILDSAAMDEGADALALATATDATILVIEAGKEKKESLNRASMSLERFNSAILGVIINRWHNDLRSYFYTEHMPIECLQSSAPVQIPQSITQISLPDTPRPPLLASARTSGKLLARVAPSVGQPGVGQSAVGQPRGLPLPYSSVPNLSIETVNTGSRQSRTLAPAKHKGIIIPARLYDLEESSQGQNLKAYHGSGRANL